MKKIKLLTSLSAVIALGGGVALIATSCNSKKEEEKKEDDPAKNGTLTFNDNNACLEYLKEPHFVDPNMQETTVDGNDSESIKTFLNNNVKAGHLADGVVGLFAYGDIKIKEGNKVKID